MAKPPSSDVVRSAVRDLLACLDESERMHAQLGLLLERHLQAVRKADLGTLRAAQEEARQLAVSLQRQDESRRRRMEEVARTHGWTGRKDRGPTLAELAECVGGDEATSLLAARERLRRLGSTTAALQRVTALSTRELLGHVKAVLGAVRPAAGRGITYGRSGALAVGAAPRLVDAVG